MSKQFRNGIWWMGADVMDAADKCIAVEADRSKVTFFFENDKDTASARELLHDYAIECSMYMDARLDLALTVSLQDQYPMARADTLVVDKDIFKPNSGCGGTRQLAIKGFGTLIIERDSMDQLWCVEDITLLPREHMFQWESGSYFWFDWLRALARDFNIDEPDMKYRFASQCSFDDLNIGV